MFPFLLLEGFFFRVRKNSGFTNRMVQQKGKLSLCVSPRGRRREREREAQARDPSRVAKARGAGTALSSPFLLSRPACPPVTPETQWGRPVSPSFPGPPLRVCVCLVFRCFPTPLMGVHNWHHLFGLFPLLSAAARAFRRLTLKRRRLHALSIEKSWEDRGPQTQAPTGILLCSPPGWRALSACITKKENMNKITVCIYQEASPRFSSSSSSSSHTPGFQARANRTTEMHTRLLSPKGLRGKRTRGGRRKGGGGRSNLL